MAEHSEAEVISPPEYVAPGPSGEKSFKDKSFNEILAEQADMQKDELVITTLEQFKKGDNSAFKMVSQALAEHKYNQENSFPISDERYKQIIEMAAQAIGTGEI